MIRAYCTDSLTIIRTEYDEYKEPSSVEEISVKGYINWKTKLVRNIEGEEVVSRGSVYILYDGDLTHEDKIKINDTKYAIITVRDVKDFSITAQEVFLA